MGRVAESAWTTIYCVYPFRRFLQRRSALWARLGIGPRSTVEVPQAMVYDDKGQVDGEVRWICARVQMQKCCTRLVTTKRLAGITEPVSRPRPWDALEPFVASGATHSPRPRKVPQTSPATSYAAAIATGSGDSVGRPERILPE